MPRLLINLPPGFYSVPESTAVLSRLDALGEVRRTSHNTAQEILPDLSWAEATLMWSWPRLDDALLDAAPGLRLAAHLDLTQAAAAVALRRGLPVTQGRGAFSPAVAEMALTLLLTSLRRTATFQEQMRRGDEPWVRRFPDDIDPQEREMTGRRVGIVGFGRIGQRLAALLAPFACPLYAVDPFVPEEVLARFGAQRATIDEAVAAVDVLVLCAASNDGTRHLLGAPQLAALRPGAVLVNVARAALIDTAALVARLQRGDLIAALDVFDTEPLPGDHPLRTLPNAYLTPHRAGGVMASVERILGLLIDDIERFFAGEPLRHPLTEAMLPALDA